MAIRKILIVTNIPTPYRIPLFNEVYRQLKVRGIELKVLFGAEGYARRKFRFQAEQCQFPFAFLGSSSVAFGDSEKTMFSYGGIMKAIRAEQADRVVVSGFSLATMRLWWRSWWTRQEYIIWSGAIAHPGRNDSFLRRLQRRLVVSRASGFLAYGTLAKDYLIGLGARPDRVGLAFNTVDTTFFSEETEGLRKSLTAGPPFHLTYVGYLSARKNVVRVLEVVKKLKESRTDFVLDLVGDGDQREELENWAKNNGLETCVVFHGYKQKENLPAILARSSVFLFQTDFDIWGLVLNEAMAAGLPVICSPHAGAAPDLVVEGETGFIMDYADTIGVANRVSQLLDYPEQARQMGIRAADRIRQRFSLTDSARAYVETLLAEG
ncbi:MAG: glycosyltransferase family 4 protein [Bacteroidota bacterium]|jgi:glycosyltransferase involved in cell wall biosynthesis|nr:glycosyltransferase family 4 protein [Bacteroidia bacterium]MBP6010503.1 glycosyltransferase family 4 protein [Bacteroidia bacterium]MBP7438290.1 glycosyltransferase family 4 protein [Bacteroidia bacterium]MBP7773310.1 glycosyltransferase family 4 protein [Bacteroidia bacterium]